MKLENKWSFLLISKERKNKIHSTVRDTRSKLFALDYLEYKNITNLPINFLNLENLFKDFEWIIYEYEEAKKYLNITDPLNIEKRKALARTFHERGSNYYLTVYRSNFKNTRMDYYTLAHELGHIVLGHLDNFTCTALSRGGISPKDYKILEREAEIFAAELIMPMPVLKEFPIKSFKDIYTLCYVTKSASRIRFREMFSKSNIYSSYKHIPNQFYNFIYKKKCLICNHGFISKDTTYCPMCGNNKLAWGNGNMIYKGFELDENGKALTCPVCENEEISPIGDYCKSCGTYLINKCSRDEEVYDNFNNVSYEKCGRVADGNARYCIFCGSKTTFYDKEILPDWTNENPQKANK